MANDLDLLLSDAWRVGAINATSRIADATTAKWKEPKRDLISIQRITCGFRRAKYQKISLVPAFDFDFEPMQMDAILPQAVSLCGYPSDSYSFCVEMKIFHQRADGDKRNRFHFHKSWNVDDIN